ncbi:unnamed protein product [Notodromas monacha]|uniref:Uncharacterized protein n=1 Tax=Notodromas monacha TaxID=399045 RepID=A0A7R9BUD0_9CRUS|nr:unnamed protein product [Notodromas monacha]CAG0920844.1 unnamed protein product [Notodromas monacha]
MAGNLMMTTSPTKWSYEEYTKMETTDLPPLFVKHYDSKKQVVECEIFALSLKYLENIVRLPMYDEKPTETQQACFGVIKKFYQNEVTGELMIEYSPITTRNEIVPLPQGRRYV